LTINYIKTYIISHVRHRLAGQSLQAALQNPQSPNPAGDLRCCGNAPALAGLPERESLANHEYSFRIRVGNWRILFDVEDRIKIIMIQEVKKRDERTY